MELGIHAIAEGSSSAGRFFPASSLCPLPPASAASGACHDELFRDDARNPTPDSPAGRCSAPVRLEIRGMTSRTGFHPVQKRRSQLGPRVCPYENGFAPARWFFSCRLREAIRAARPSCSGRVLEIGCWEGFFLPTLLLNYSRVAAIDNDSGSLVERTPERWTTLQSARDLCLRENVYFGRMWVLKASDRSSLDQSGPIRVKVRPDCFIRPGCRERS